MGGLRTLFERWSEHPWFPDTTTMGAQRSASVEETIS